MSPTTHTGKKLPDVHGIDLERLLAELTAIRAELVAVPDSPRHCLDEVHANYRKSARNLLHYLALRRRDLRPLQLRLAALGLSSIGRAESHVLATIDAILQVLHRLVKRPWHPSLSPETEVIDFMDGQRLLAEHTESLLGPASPERGVRIMVTMPSEAADDYTIIENLLQQGMNCMRINCAHDEPTRWLQMIDNLKRAERSLGLPCKVVMDLAGPKLRTGPLEPGPAVIRIRPRRDVFGRVVAPARVWLTPKDAARQPPTPASATLPVPGLWLARLRLGDRLTCADARHARRSFTVVDVTDGGCWAESVKTAYIVPGTVLRRRGGRVGIDDETVVEHIPSQTNSIFLQQGDLLVLTLDSRPGRPAVLDSAGQVLTPAMIGCTIPAVFEDVRSGEPVWFDDGKIGGVIEKVENDRVHIRITHAPLRGARLKGDKGINLPDSDFRLAAMTAKDVEDLSFVAQHADVVELSFANTAHDVESLQQHLEYLGTRQPAIVLKIETRRAFENLPDMLFAVMRTQCCGVMIARGDLAVECGFERLAEVQEEILWICEAAHVPVIWATQVLETLAKKGMPSRAEITDAAMGDRAECVMLNKGPHVVNAVRVLHDILHRMQSHQSKKLSMLRELRLAHG
ncbi:MAG: pyruvate kinase [Desulfocapsaceae bacterium]|nr:pyruvate kinase [Desulfocapsaceae bacterium]